MSSLSGHTLIQKYSNQLCDTIHQGCSCTSATSMFTNTFLCVTPTIIMFQSYSSNVEVRDRVKCISATEGLLVYNFPFFHT